MGGFKEDLEKTEADVPFSEKAGGREADVGEKTIQ
jgi:hypothetical protein